MGIFKNIKEGWTNYIQATENYDNLSDDIKAMAESRADTCKSCPHLVESGLFKVIDRILPNSKEKTKMKVAYNSEIHNSDGVMRGYKCNQCGCGFPANVFAPAKKCPKNKWKK